MILGSEQLSQLIWPPNGGVGIIDEPDKEQTKLEGGKYEFRLYEAHEMTVRRSDDVAFIGTNARKTPRYELAAHLHHYPEILCVESGHYYLFETLEAVNMPLWLTGILTPRTTLFRSGIIVSVGALDPGYKKRLAFGAFATHDIHIERGARIVSCRFAAIGDSTAYNGVWQGGKIHTDGEVVEGFDLEL